MRVWRIGKIVALVVLGTLGTIVLAAFLWVAAHEVYRAAPVSARVVDAETGMGIPDVTVVADWQVEGGLEGGRALGHAALLEARTDIEGRFFFPGWGPRLALSFWGSLKNRDPMLLFFKAGYLPHELVNDPPRQHSLVQLRTSDWDGATISLEPASRYSRERYANAVEFFVRRLEIWFIYPGGCAWRAISHLLLAVSREEDALSQQDPKFRRQVSHFGGTECRFDFAYVRKNGEWFR